MNRIIAFFSRKEAVIEEPAEDPMPVLEPVPGPGEVICYYGCPNSSKAKKLQLSKKAYR